MSTSTYNLSVFCSECHGFGYWSVSKKSFGLWLSAALTGTKVRKTVLSNAETAGRFGRRNDCFDVETAVLDSEMVVSVANTARLGCRKSRFGAETVVVSDAE